MNISKEFPFKSQFIDVLGSKMHYIEEGTGDPILFLHGNPTSNYIWRNIIPHLKGKGRCIAPDLIGMGKSGKPDISYGFFDSYHYIEAFINKLGLKKSHWFYMTGVRSMVFIMPIYIVRILKELLLWKAYTKVWKKLICLF